MNRKPGESDAGALMASLENEVHDSRVELRLAAIEQFRKERIQALDNLLAKIEAERQRAQGFRRAELQQLLDTALDQRSRFGEPIQ